MEYSYKKFFNKRSGYQVFKNKFSKQSYRTTCIKNSYKGNNYGNIEIDLGIKDLIITSDGEKYSNPKEILKRIQKKLSRQVKEGNQ